MDPHKTPDETYGAHQRFRKRDQDEKIYRCLERLLKEFPDDMELLEEMLDLTMGQMRDPQLARRWLVRRIKLVPCWRDYVLLSEVEALSGNLKKAEESLGVAKALQKRQHSLIGSPREATKMLDRARGFIRLQEHNQWVQRISSAAHTEPGGAKETAVPRGASVPQSIPATESKKTPSPPEQSEPEPPPVSPVLPPLHSYGVPIRFAPVDLEAMSAMLKTPGTLNECQLRVQYACLDAQRGFRRASLSQ